LAVFLIVFAFYVRSIPPKQPSAKLTPDSAQTYLDPAFLKAMQAPIPVKEDPKPDPAFLKAMNTPLPVKPKADEGETIEL